MDAIECIKTRRGVRRYADQPIDKQAIHQILEAGISAPSRKNGQPWKFKVVTDKELINNIYDLSIHGSWMKTAPLIIVIFLDNACSYDRLKDIQSCGAVMQNMMLTAYSLDIGSCWIGEILPKAKEVKQVLKLNDESLELMGIVLFGHKSSRMIDPGRKRIESFLL